MRNHNFTPARIIRAIIEGVPGPMPPLDERQREMRRRIQAGARDAMAEHGWPAITLPELAAAIGIASGTTDPSPSAEPPWARMHRRSGSGPH